MKYRSCVAVLIGEHTASRQWVEYEIRKAWEDRKGVFGIYIHNLKCPRKGISRKGKNPFDYFNLKSGGKLSDIVKCYDPNSYDAYKDISSNMEKWVSNAIDQRK